MSAETPHLVARSRIKNAVHPDDVKLTQIGRGASAAATSLPALDHLSFDRLHDFLGWGLDTGTVPHPNPGESERGSESRLGSSAGRP